MPDRFVVRTIAVGLVATLALCLVGVIVLAFNDHDAPEILKSVALTALGAVAGFLAKTNTEQPPVQPVNVVGQPVETTEVPARRRKRDAGTSEIGLGLFVALLILAVALGLVVHPLFWLLLLACLLVLAL